MADFVESRSEPLPEDFEFLLGQAHLAPKLLNKDVIKVLHAESPHGLRDILSGGFEKMELEGVGEEAP